MNNISNQKLIDFLNFEFWGNTGGDYLYALLIFIGISIVFKVFQVIVLHRLNKFALKTETKVDNLAIQVVRELKPPFYFLIAVYISLQFLTLAEIADKIIDVLFIVIVTYQVVRVVNKIVDFVTKIISEKEEDINENIETSESVAAVKLIGNVAKAVVWVMGILIVLSNLGVNVTSLIAGLGIGGVAVAFALQNILSDVFSSVSIFVDKPFRVGDFVTIGGKYSGTIKEIGVQSTRIQTLQGEEMIVPNKDITTGTIQNFNQMERRRVAYDIGVVYGTEFEKLKKIPEIVKRAVETTEKATFDRTHFKSYGDFSLIFEIVYHVESSSYDTYMDIQQEVNLKIYELFENEGLEFAYPTQTILLNKG